MASTDQSPVELVVEYDDAEDLLGDFADNLSSGGTFVATERELPIGAPVELALTFPGLVKPIAIDAVVRGTRRDVDAPIGADLEFDVGGRAALAAQIERIRARDPELLARLFRVLLVEDNRHIAALIQNGLSAAIRREFRGGVAFAFRGAEDGRTAVEILHHEAFDALIVDVYLPVLDGPHVIAEARSELGLSDLSIIAISAGGDAARKAALRAGANTFLDKPMRLVEMTAVVKRLLHIEPPRDRPLAAVT
jgi:CheY-like chemotaxis protein